MKLGLGTVQFGLNYGISNTHGQVDTLNVQAILQRAWEAGITLLDTARTYGNSEAVLGSTLPPGAPFQIVTKTPVVPDSIVTVGHGAAIRSALQTSLARLGQERLYGLLVHHATDLLKPGGERLIEALHQEKASGRVEKIGVSIYDGAELDAVLERFTPDIVQLPINIVDQRLIHSGHLARLKALGVEIHGRSLFLQGLLLMPPENLPDHFRPIQGHFIGLYQSFSDHGWTALAGCLHFALQREELDTVLVGVTSLQELQDILTIVDQQSPNGDSFDFDRWALVDKNYLNPSLWHIDQ